ncbi:MAG: hypothetical protein WBD20_16025 [Pirellulaceae bacterium]
MSDTIALARLLFARSRTQLIVWSAWTLVSIVIALMAGALFEGKYLAPFLFIPIFPVVLWSLAMFEFGNEQSMIAGESGHSHWLLRMPIADWKLAFVPLVLRFTWMSLFYATIVLVAGIATGTWLPVWTGLILFFAGGAWLSAIAWRPFRSMWRRVWVMIVAVALYYLLFMVVMSVHFDDKTDVMFLRNHPLLVKTTTAIVTCLTLASGLWMAFSSLKLARTNGLGLVPERHTKFTGWIGRIEALVAPDASNPIMHRSGRAALTWHDTRRMVLQSQNWSLFIVVGSLITILMFLPIPVANALFVMFLFCQLGVMSGSSQMEPTKLHGSSLPTYIAASPMTCAEIGFTRGLTGVWTSYLGVLVFALAYGVCLMMPYNQGILSDWFTKMESIYGTPVAAYRWIALIAIAVIAMVPSRSLAFTWPTMTGRSRLSLAALTLPIVVLFAAGGGVCAWFLKQAKGNWETTIANAWYWAGWIPTLLVTLLVVKFLASAVAATQTLRHKLITPKTAALIAGCWLIATIGFAALSHSLIPDQRILFVWTLMVTALALPLGRILVLPYAVYLNRYR